MGSNMGSRPGSLPQTPGATPQPSRPASMDYGPRTPAPQQGGAPGSLQGHQVAFSDFGSDIGSNIGSMPGAFSAESMTASHGPMLTPLLDTCIEAEGQVARSGPRA